MTGPGEDTPPLKVLSAEQCRFDEVSLGEIMLRLDPGDVRIRTTRQFQVWEGGGEYNVARGLRRCFGMRTAVVTALADNEIGRLIEDLMLQGGVDLSFLRWVPYDGIGRRVRNGLNFTERGFGCAAHSAHLIAPTARQARCVRGRWTGNTSSANSRCAGCTQAASTPRCRRPLRR